MIDAHQHLWRIGQNDCAWPHAGLPQIHRDHEPADLLAAAAPLGVTGSVLVQSQPSDRDTDYLLALAETEPFILGVVGWADLLAPDASARIADLAARPKLKGLRPMLQSLEPDDWILQPALEPAIAAMVEQGLVFDALVYPRHLDALLRFVRRHPALGVVIDHGAKPAIARMQLDPWRAGIAALAAEPNVTCKLSGLPTEAAPGQDIEAYRPYVDHLVAEFGPERLIWGSDWPVLNLAADYAAWLALAQTLTAPLGEAAQAAIFETNARRVYRL